MKQKKDPDRVNKKVRKRIKSSGRFDFVGLAK